MNKNEIIKFIESCAESRTCCTELNRRIRNNAPGAIELVKYLESKKLDRYSLFVELRYTA